MKEIYTCEICGKEFKVVWEFDYTKDKQKVIQECIEFLEE